MDTEDTDHKKANTTAVLDAAGLVGAVCPFVASFAPSKLAKAAGAPVTVDISELAMGEQKTVVWRGMPVWIIRHSTDIEEGLIPQDPALKDPF